MITLYKPKEDNKGILVSFQFGKGSRDKISSVFITFIKQFSYKNGNGTFKENAKCPVNSLKIKLNVFELGDFINAFENNLAFYPNNILKISRKNELSETHVTLSRLVSSEKNGYKLLVEKDERRFLVGITIGEATAIREMFRWGILTILAETNDQYNETPSHVKKSSTVIEDVDEKDLLL